MDLSQKDYLVIVQCDIVKERCPATRWKEGVYQSD